MSTFVLIVLGLVLVAETPALAYLDPGSGSMLVQLLLGGVAAVGVALRLGWQRLRAWRPGSADRRR